MAIPSYLHGKRYPFIFSLSLLILAVTLVLMSNSQYSTFFSFSSLPTSFTRLRQIPITSSLYFPPEPQSPPPLPPPIIADVAISAADRLPPLPPQSKIQETPIVLPPEDQLLRDDPPSLRPPPAEIQETAIIRPPTDWAAPLMTRGEIEIDENLVNLKWKVCEGPVAVDYIPCLDNFKAMKKLKKNLKKHMAHRERHCPTPSPRCLVPLPRGYKLPILWPKSREMIWYDNVPHPKLVDYKKDQNWVVRSDDYFVFPGGGTQFREGAASYIKFIEEAVPAVRLGRNIRVVLDVGCGVASFGGNLMDRDVLTMSFAPKDEHEAQIQFALERGIPAILSVIGTQQLTFPNNVYDLIHCARCRVPWHEDGGKPLLELNRVLRPGGFFVWSATPVYLNDERHVSIWNSMVALTQSMCWKLLTKAMAPAGVGLVVYQKPTSPSCYKERKNNDPPMYTPLQRCLSQLPPGASRWPPLWPERLSAKPLGLPPTLFVEELFHNDTKYWSDVVSDVYLGGLGINWTNVRNVMDMTASHGGFAAALEHMPLWVMNVVQIQEPDTLPIIFDRGLIGVYHDWCESFSTYPRTYDLLHSNFLFSNLPKRCDIIDLVAEMDRIVRPGGYVLVQESKEMINKVGSIFRSLQWSVSLYNDQYLVGHKSLWRPEGGEVQR
ncbi:hypothetical protein Cgig2_032763 [Carnegiea gigantea]|uniref:Methyltransferase n=1 Tax=Carnegiea gigantea TaxID=171969 RepID=A0A9Q1QJB9_9CARY|nr:hypothetical protein Cgig2_032763 [Carnegiea gigantea]